MLVAIAKFLAFMPLVANCSVTKTSSGFCRAEHPGVSDALIATLHHLNQRVAIIDGF